MTRITRVEEKMGKEKGSSAVQKYAAWWERKKGRCTFMSGIRVRSFNEGRD